MDELSEISLEELSRIAPLCGVQASVSICSCDVIDIWVITT